jgi:hypothetical protein
MRRLEVIANQSVQVDLVEGLEAVVPRLQYTLISPVQGSGLRKKKVGDTVWPEVNFILISYMEDEYIGAARASLERLKERFPAEGIAFFDLGG